METERTIRRLAAVLFADVVGYSRLMAEDEVRALAGLNRLRETAFNPAVARHNGRIVKLMGDGTLVEFGSVFDAVDCAIAIQTAIASSDGQPAMPLRIGVNLGDIIIQGDDIYGDGVNIAARLETQARPGGVCISSVVNESVRSRSGSMFVDGGEVTVKNIARPIHVWHWHPADTATSGSTVESNAAPPQPEREPETASIAVLAFDNMSGDADQEYFSDGISEDIITDLSKVPGLMVIARNSSFAYKGKAVDIRTVGQELGVGHVLEGSVRRAGDRVRVTAQLIDAVTGGHVWAERFDRDLEDIFAVQDEVALKIVDALKIRLSPGEEANIASIGTTNMAAHDSFLRMRDLVLSPALTPEKWKRAMEFGARAIELDPTYAQALGLYSIFHWLDFHNGWSGDSPETVAAKAGTFAERAMAVDPNDPLANNAVAVAARWAGDYDRAIAANERASSVTPNAPLVLFTRADIAIGAGRPQDAVPVLERAIRLDPAWTHQHLQFLGMAHFLQGNYETAALIFRERIVLANDTDIGRAWLAASLGHLGEVAEAREVWADLMTINPKFVIAPRLTRFLYARAQDPENVLAGLAQAGLPISA
jgi:adenylate cyclase